MTTKRKDTVLITGASSGIGAAYAERFAQRGHNLILVARDFARLEVMANRLWAAHGVNVEVEAADLSRDADLKRIETRLRHDPRIGVLVNNAGVATRGGLLEGDDEEIDNLVAVNVLAPTRLAAAAAEGFVARGGGSIVNIASVLALAPERTNPAYGGSKAYLLNFSQALHQEVGGKGVYVQAVLPGLTRTEIFDRVGRSMSGLDPERIMDVGDLVDAALAGFDRKELVTIPPLPDDAQWGAFEAARLAMQPNLSLRRPAIRYRAKEVA